MSEMKHKKICRFCLSQNKSFSYLFGDSNGETSWQIKAIQVLSLEILPSDELPKLICNVCQDIVNAFYNYKQSCKKAEILLKLFPITKSVPEPLDLPKSLLEVIKTQLPASPEKSSKSPEKPIEKPRRSQTDPDLKKSKIDSQKTHEKRDKSKEKLNQSPEKPKIPEKAEEKKKTPKKPEVSPEKPKKIEENEAKRPKLEKSPEKPLKSPEVSKKSDKKSQNDSGRSVDTSHVDMEVESPAKIHKSPKTTEEPIKKSPIKEEAKEPLKKAPEEPEKMDVSILASQKSVEKMDISIKESQQKMEVDLSQEPPKGPVLLNNGFFKKGKEAEEEEEEEHFELADIVDDEEAGPSEESGNLDDSKENEQGDNIVFKCSSSSDCDKVFSNKQLLADHVASEHKQEIKASDVDEKFKCGACPKKFAKFTLLIRHEQMAHKDLPKFDCATCSKQFLNKELYEKHLLTHEKQKMACPKCEKKFVNDKNLQKHIQAVHASQKKQEPEVTLEGALEIPKVGHIQEAVVLSEFILENNELLPTSAKRKISTDDKDQEAKKTKVSPATESKQAVQNALSKLPKGLLVKKESSGKQTPQIVQPTLSKSLDIPTTPTTSKPQEKSKSQTLLNFVTKAKETSTPVRKSVNIPVQQTKTNEAPKILNSIAMQKKDFKEPTKPVILNRAPDQQKPQILSNKQIAPPQTTQAKQPAEESFKPGNQSTPKQKPVRVERIKMTRVQINALLAEGKIEMKNGNLVLKNKDKE